jgi:hypothetical protein
VRNRVKRTALCLLALAAVLVPRGPTTGGVPLVDDQGVRYGWDLTTEQPNVQGGKVTYFPAPATLRDESIGQKTPLQAIRDGVASWQVGTTSIAFAEDTSRTAAGVNGTDRVNWIGWVSSGLDSLTLAATTITRTDSTLTDMDVALNDRFSWDMFEPGRAGIADIESLIAHEWGHAIGCDHVPLRASTMYPNTLPGVISLRTLSPDDRALVGSMYPNANFAATTGTIAGNVDVAGTANDRAVHVVAVSVATGEPAASTLSRPDGTYSITGLPAGVYRVIAAPCIPIASMNAFWSKTGTTRFVPSVLRQGGSNPGAIVPVTVATGQTATVAPMTVADTSAVFEPNDTSAQATPIAVGDAACARFESGADQDWYAFDGVAGQKVTIAVLCWGLGADADPALTLLDTAGQVAQIQDDVRPPSLHFSQIEGQDLDVRVAGVALTQTGVYRVGLRNEKGTSGSNGFYVLLVTPSSDAPSAILTQVTVTPPRTDAGSGQTSRIVVRPRNETNDDVGPGAAVTITHSGAGTLTPVTDAGDGTYYADVTAAATPGDDLFTVSCTSAQGTATLLDAAKIVYLGPADPARSTFTVVPRRLDIAPLAPDPALVTQATVSFVPTDARGEALGPGRTVAFTLVAPGGASLGGPFDFGDGGYGDSVHSGTARGTGAVSASVGGAAFGADAPVAFGFGLFEVLTATRADAALHSAVPGVSKKAMRAFAKADALAAKGLARLAEGGPKAESRAIAAAQAALAQVALGRKKAHVALPDLGTERDLARAIRESAAAAIEAAVPDGRRDERRIADAREDLVSGDAAYAGGAAAKPASRWRRAFSRVLPLQPL